MGKLEGKIAFVTGAAAGNGRAMAVRFAMEGADVAIADVDDDGMRETAALVREQGRQALTVHCDVSKKADIDAALAATVSRFGRLNISVANAGIVEQGTICLTMTEQEWDRTIDINLKGAFFTLQGSANQMLGQGSGGRLIAIASIMGEWGSPSTAAYCASKGGVRQLVKSFAQVTGPLGITCNAIGPGFIATAMTQFMRDVPVMEAFFVDRTPVGRIGVPEDVAAVAAFLASDEASFVNGTIIYPDGGIMAGPYSAQLGSLMAPGNIR